MTHDINRGCHYIAIKNCSKSLQIDVKRENSSALSDLRANPSFLLMEVRCTRVERLLITIVGKLCHFSQLFSFAPTLPNLNLRPADTSRHLTPGREIEFPFFFEASRKSAPLNFPLQTVSIILAMEMELTQEKQQKSQKRGALYAKGKEKETILYCD